MVALRSYEDALDRVVFAIELEADAEKRCDAVLGAPPDVAMAAVNASLHASHYLWGVLAAVAYIYGTDEASVEVDARKLMGGGGE